MSKVILDEVGVNMRFLRKAERSLTWNSYQKYFP